MNKSILNRPIKSSIIIFLICLVFRMIEYFVIKTDETFISENFIHKVIGIVILYFVLKNINYKFKDIGFSKRNWIKQVLLGLILGLICFTISYVVEYIVLALSNKEPKLSIFVTGFSITGNDVKHTELIYFILCILFNIINVFMEEGIFRGLFIKIISNKENFVKANLIAALLFGVWHFVMPIRSLINGDMTVISAIIMMIGYIILSGMMSIKWGLLYKMTGSLWVGIGDHLFNNVITNLLHIVCGTEVDELQIVRILIAQLISFISIVVLYNKYRKRIKNAKTYKHIN